jgi:hypothetical protein
MFDKIQDVDAVISCAGNAAFRPFADLTDADYELGLRSKLMGQVTLARVAKDHLREGGSITLTTGILAMHPMPGSASISRVNAGLEGFVRAATAKLTHQRFKPALGEGDDGEIGHGPDLRPSLGRCCEGVCGRGRGLAPGSYPRPAPTRKIVAAPLCACEVGGTHILASNAVAARTLGPAAARSERSRARRVAASTVANRRVRRRRLVERVSPRPSDCDGVAIERGF